MKKKTFLLLSIILLFCSGCNSITPAETDAISAAIIQRIEEQAWLEGGALEHLLNTDISCQVYTSDDGQYMRVGTNDKIERYTDDEVYWRLTFAVILDDDGVKIKSTTSVEWSYDSFAPKDEDNFIGDYVLSIREKKEPLYPNYTPDEIEAIKYAFLNAFPDGELIYIKKHHDFETETIVCYRYQDERYFAIIYLEQMTFAKPYEAYEDDYVRLKKVSVVLNE